MMRDIFLHLSKQTLMLASRSLAWLSAHNSMQPSANFSKPAMGNIIEGVAVIPVHGILTKRPALFDGILGMTSYDAIQQHISAALADEGVQTILLDIDSPGGETSGIFDLSDFIFHSRKQKHIWAVCNDEAYSAAYAIASSCEKVFISRTSGVGSIGVIASHIDQSAFDEKHGIKYTTIFAGQHKNDLNPHAPITATATQTLQLEVDRLYEMFVELVARNRNLTPNAVRATEAGIYFGNDAIALGLADEILSFPVCIPKGFSLRTLTPQDLARRQVVSARSVSYIRDEARIHAVDAAQSLKGEGYIHRALTQPPIRSLKMTENISPINDDALLAEAKTQGRGEYHTELLELVRLCKLSRMPEKLGEFIEQNINVTEAREQLMQMLASRTNTEILSTISPGAQPLENPVIQAAKARSINIK